MHQTHNNENGQMWQKKEKEGTRKVPSNTGRRRLNIIGALNLENLDVVSFLTEENCNKETIKVFLKEVKITYYETFEEFELFVTKFFQGWEKWKPELKTLLTLNFEVIS